MNDFRKVNYAVNVLLVVFSQVVPCVLQFRVPF